MPFNICGYILYASVKEREKEKERQRDWSIIETVFCVAGRAIGHERDQEGKYPLEGGCERSGEGHGVEPKGGIMDSHQQQFCLKWNSFGSNLATTFSNLFKSESLTDVTLFCEGKFHAKTVVLSPSAFFCMNATNEFLHRNNSSTRLDNKRYSASRINNR